MQPVQLGEIDALTVEAESPAEGRHQKADRDDAPAIVTDRGLVDDGMRGGVHATLCLEIRERLLAASVIGMLRSAPKCHGDNDRQAFGPDGS